MLLNTASVASIGVFIGVFVFEVGVGNRFLYGLLTISLFFKILEVVFEWYHFWVLKEPTNRDLPPPKPKRAYTVDMLTTACPGEPFEMIANTLRAMVAVTYPHTSYLCDEGDDPELKALCAELGVVHVTRSTHENAKAGNINNALRQATGEICVILDPDHAPYPQFLDYVLHYFDNPKIGYVQVVQAYKNQSESLVAHAAAEQTYMYYGPYMEAMSKFGTAQAIGANCTFRRAALDSIGGHAPGLTEDMHTSMLLHAKGWESVYEPKILSLGLVPSSLNAFYQQQLKWSRGTFDLWLNKLPKLFSKYTWKQKFHYFLLPVYFLFGLIGIIDVVIPIYSLYTGEYPWKLDPSIFFAAFLPFLGMSLIQRFYAQRWLHKRDEKGLHILGGILRVGTWWVYSLGFIYTLINKKVPYIPTPKEHSSKGDFKLGLPNLIISVASFAAVFYGLSNDWQPYSWLMASFAFMNGFIFFCAFFLGQFVWVNNLRAAWFWFKNRPVIESAHLTYNKVNKIALPTVMVLPIVLSIIFVFVTFDIKLPSDYNRVLSNSERNFGGNYTGIYHASYDQTHDFSLIKQAEKEVGTDWAIISTYLYWSDLELPLEKWKEILNHGSIPMITWEPFVSGLEWVDEWEDLSQNQKVFKYIVEGFFDEYILEVAKSIRDLNAPVFLRFAHEMDNPMYPWSMTGGNTPEEFKAAWKHIHYLFGSVGAQNVSWVFNPWDPENLSVYYPFGGGGSVTEFVDWVGLTALNYGPASVNGNPISFETIYRPFKDQLDAHNIDVPVMLSEFGSVSYSTDASIWVGESVSAIKSFPEIKALVWFFSDIDKNWITDWRPLGGADFIDWTFDLSKVSRPVAQWAGSKMPVTVPVSDNLGTVRPSSLQGMKGDFTLTVNGSPFYMKGICYNTGHDWEEGFVPLSRKQVAGDFEKMKKAGANTIRRYEPGIYDRNILREANLQGLKVMYGFWFDPKVDYLSDRKELAAYERKVLQSVKKHKDNEAIVAWNIGNETWGLLKKRYGQPYLTMVRKSYISFLEELAQKIREIDPTRPILSSEEHDNIRLIGTIHDYRAHAPSLDAIGINSYYEENISLLDDIFTEFDPDRPYVVTEFGPKGYWNPELGDYWSDSVLIELSSVSKGEYYHRQWTQYIEANKGKNLGGFAFSWQDRFEGTATWFGITDFKGNPKPAYYYLASAWLGTDLGITSFPDITIVGQWQDVRPNERIWLSAATINEYSDSLTYKWEVYEEGSWKRSNPVVNSIENNRFVEIKVPKKPSRVYVHAYDSHGNVITASRPLQFTY
ncbi:hypothetical protein ADIS_2979 [Lunatimonas lonarensis]|uniref:GH26 domain-containing protein n=2 Tax=Lunatimonas lonarensis TaxID=1232681 RepID=R7ZR88_9BACT|nr:hypothetical protein ADIS_2979 [Lunatimonas lonarensis]